MFQSKIKLDFWRSIWIKKI